MPRAPKKRHVPYGRTVLAAEASAISSLVGRLGPSFDEAVELLARCKGRVVATGIGKPGFIAQKLSATLSSIGTPSLYLHPAEAAHGDIGRVSKGDVVIALSNSGATQELVDLILPLKRLKVPVVAVTGGAVSPLARGASVVIDIGTIDEACPIGLVPTASSAALHAIADALAMALARAREFTPEEYARYHPGGTLGRSVMRVSEIMRRGDQHPKVREHTPLSRVVVVMTNTRGRPGATNVVDARGKLLGIFTDGDLRRLVERGELDFSTPVKNVMARQPRCARPEELAHSAAATMRDARVDQLPVVDAEGRAVGLLDVQDLLAARIA